MKRAWTRDGRKEEPKAKPFVTYLKFHRYQRGKTQAQIAKEIGVTQAAYCDYERGRRHPRPKTHKKLAEALGRPIAEVTGKLYDVDPNEMVTQKTASR